MRKPEKRNHLLLLDGKEASEKEYKQIMSQPAAPAEKDSLATKPLHHTRPFKFLR